ncbi:unnamed protein product [marine sediment metagenome]|uniref:Uncharacterized protein n=1 Tax=marine sediment metagenome TaxID=412755 RepID=X1EC49_9ZZZZ
MAKPGHGYCYATIDGILVSKPCNVVAVNFTPTTGADSVTIYDGQDALSGEIFMHLAASVIISRQAHFGKGAYCRNGVYVVFSAGVGRLTLVYDTVETL